jgi:hypothetical protein
MKKNMKMLDLDDLGSVSGGIIVETDNRDRGGKYAIVDDRTGKVYTRMNSRDDAKRAAVANFGTTDDIVGPKDYAEKFGKALPL